MSNVLLDASGNAEVYPEEGAGVVACAFTDLSGTAVIPNAIAWTLLTPAGTVVNSRKQVVVATPAASIDILLSGNDLAILDGADYENRYLILEWTFDDATYGNNLPGKDQVQFTVENLRKII